MKMKITIALLALLGACATPLPQEDMAPMCVATDACGAYRQECCCTDLCNEGYACTEGYCLERKGK